jgi:hypothetical protein
MQLACTATPPLNRERLVALAAAHDAIAIPAALCDTCTCRQMMVGINIFSIFFTTMALLRSGEMFSTLAFISEHPSALNHLAILSVTR